MTIRRLTPLLAVACSLGLAGLARASISYTYVTDQTNYTAAAGASVTVSIFLNENLSGSSTSLEGPNDGLVGAGFYVVNSTGQGGATITAINPNANANDPANPGQPGDGFNGGSGVTTSKTVKADGSAARLLESTNDFPGVIGAANSSGTQLLLGTVVIKAGAAGSTTSFTLETYKNAPTSLGGSGLDGNTVDYGLAVSGVSNDYDVSGTDATTGQSYTGADGSQFETFTVTVAAVPEPNGLVLSGLVASCGLFGGLGFVGYRRGRAFFLKGNAAA